MWTELYSRLMQCFVWLTLIIFSWTFLSNQKLKQRILIIHKTGSSCGSSKSSVLTKCELELGFDNICNIVTCMMCISQKSLSVGCSRCDRYSNSHINSFSCQQEWTVEKCIIVFKSLFIKNKIVIFFHLFFFPRNSARVI